VSLGSPGARNLIERFSNKIEQRRRVATRYDRLAANNPAFIQTRINPHMVAG
jgi:transposase